MGVAMSDLQNDEFYIGYELRAATGQAAFLRRWVASLILAAVALAATLAASQSPFAVAFFEFGKPRSFEGVLSAGAHPMLAVSTPGQGSDPSLYYLVGSGKYGPRAEVGDLAGQRVRLEGTLIYRQDQTMIEIVPGSVEVLGAEAPSLPTVEAMGKQTLRGEIVDGKCYLGVMKPGSHKPHRACASLCIRGGVPPIFVVRDAEGLIEHYLLVAADGGALGEAVLPYVAEPLEITGAVERRGSQQVLRADPASFQRVEP
jgi:hypothetical protein